MRVLFISVTTEINMPTLPLGLACVATATQRAGHQVKLLDLSSKKDSNEVIRESTEAFHPDTIGISVRNIDDQSMVDTQFLLDQVKAVVTDCRDTTEVPIILGGAGYSMYPESTLAYLEADMGIKGEGERAFPYLLDHIQHVEDISEIPGLFLPGKKMKIKNQFAKDLDILAFPDERLWLSSELINQDIWIPLQTRRGCPMKCSYCSTASIEGKIRRKHSPEAVVEMIGRHVKAGFNKFYFTDNTFNIPSSYAAEICHRLLALGLEISWMCILYPWDIKESLVRDMAKAGCREVSLGFESGSERILSNMNKKFTVKEVLRTSELLNKYGIRQMGFLLFGGPGETKSSVEKSLTFADSLPLDALKITVGIRIYPNTMLAKIAVDEGLISPNDGLLYPRFYLTKGLEGWLHETVKEWMNKRPHWII
ncbi:MAG: radical SAM protein [Deltaproteobacteria bacterium]|nr:radical SAM protein [Deltaproteobacteria bacterium]